MNFELIKAALIKALAEEGITEYEIYYTSGSDNSVETLNLRNIKPHLKMATGMHFALF